MLISKYSYLKVSLLIIFIPEFAISKIDIYKGDTGISFGCNLELAEPFSCVCLYSGLWRIWTSCIEFEYLAVNDKYCFPVIKPVKRLEKVTVNTSVLTIINPPHTIDFNQKESIPLQKDAIIITHGSKTVQDEMNEICLINMVDKAYCIYNLTGILTSVVSVKSGCTNGDFSIEPIECISLSPDLLHCTQDYSQQFQGIGLPGPESELEIENDLARPKRMFLPSSVNATPFANAEDPYEEDEDFWDETAEPAQAHLFVTSEVWNYLDQKTNQILKTGTLYKPKYNVPIFKFLELSKQIAQKICPPWYVQPEFYDMTVHAFIGLITKRKFFMELKNDFDGFTNIEKNLNACLANATQFKFERFPNDTCKPPVPEGTYNIQVNVSQTEINIAQRDMSDNHDPIIDTVWQVIYSIHQYCFPFFNNTESVNDHHRYSIMMESLFQSPLYEIWASTNTTAKMYDGLLGDLQTITRRSTYCTTLARVETELYPYDLIRPQFDPDYNKDKRKRRRRRSLLSNNNAEITRGDAAFCYQSQNCTDY